MLARHRQGEEDPHRVGCSSRLVIAQRDEVTSTMESRLLSKNLSSGCYSKE